MTRPALVIGLGGTGQWVLTYLKKDLLELHDGKMPSNVKLLAFDTVSETEAETHVIKEAKSERDYEKLPKRVGSITLDRGSEFIHIGGDCKPLGDLVKKGRYPHFDWFDLEYWEKTLPRANWILDKGAGRFRQFGLCALYKDLLGGSTRSEVRKRLSSALNELASQVEGTESFEVIIVSSVAGGTGSAMLIPFGILARALGGDRPIKTRAVVILPTAFSSGKSSEELELRSGAALRELARVMMVPEGYKSRITLVPGDRILDGVEYSRPFDGIYFIDGMREGQPLSTDPRYGVFPAAATWIRQILDDRAGDWFTRYVSTNRAGSQVNDPRRMAEGVFGIFGVYSLYIPIRTLRQTYQLKLADELLRSITKPVPEGPGGSLISKRLPKGAPLTTERALTILSQPANWKDEQQTITPIFTEIARIIKAGGPNSNPDIDRYAQVSLKTRLKRKSRLKEQGGWLGLVTGVPQIAKFDELRQEIDKELNADFRSQFRGSYEYNPPKNPCDSSFVIQYTKDIPSFLHEHYGGMGAEGPNDYGSFGDVIQKCIDAHFGIFKNALRIHLNELLTSKTGGIGYSIAVLKALENQLEAFKDFMSAVERRRTDRASRAQLDQAVIKAEENWNRWRCHPPTLLEKLQKKYSSKAVRAEEALLDAHERRINYVREEALHVKVKQLANRMQEFVLGTRQELERWEAMLLEGDTAQGIPGLLKEIEKEKRQVLATVRADKRVEDVETLVQVREREGKVHSADIEWALEGVKWDIGDNITNFVFTLTIEPSGITGGKLELVKPNMPPMQRKRLHDGNKHVLGQVLVQRFGQVEKIMPMLDWLISYYGSADELAVELAEKTKPLTSLLPGAQPGMEAFSVSLYKEEDVESFSEGLQDKLRELIVGSKVADNEHPVEVLDSEDPYRLTAVRNQVGLTLDDFSTWENCRDAYVKAMEKVENAPIQVQKEVLAYLRSQFTQKAEKEAIAIELKWRAEGRGARVLNPRLVALLGQRAYLEMALIAWALGWVRRVQDKHSSGRQHWILQIPGEEEFWLTENRRLDEAHKPFEVLESFVLVGRNYSRDRRGVKLNWVRLREAIDSQRIALKNAPSPLCIAIEKALGDDGLISQWRSIAGGHVDPLDDKLKFREPIYRDLADFAEDYFKGILSSCQDGSSESIKTNE